MVSRAGREENWGVTARNCEVSLCRDKKSSEIDLVMEVQPHDYSKSHRVVQFKSTIWAI